MKKIAVLTLTLASLISLKALAEVQFLPEATENKYIKSPSVSLSDSDRCRNAGYVYTSCEGALADECPYQNGFYKTCCPAGYTHSLSECTGNISSGSCHGFYKCDISEESASQKCLNEGYTSRTNNISECVIPPGTSPHIEECPYATGYYKCVYVELDMSYYCSHGYNQRCSECRSGMVIEVCPYDSSYCNCYFQVW